MNEQNELNELNELKISYLDNYVYLELNSETKELKFESDCSIPSVYVTRRLQWLVENPEFLDFLINNYNTKDEEVVDFDTLMLKHDGGKSHQLLFFRAKLAINCFNTMKKTLEKLKYKPEVRIKLSSEIKNFSIENIVKLKQSKQMQEFINYDYIEAKYPEMYI